jgi:hypothetical protein
MYKSSAIFVRRTRHLRGCIGEELNNRATSRLAEVSDRGAHRTFLEDRSPVDPHNGRIGIFIFLAVTHGQRGELLSFMNRKARS